MSQDIEKVSRLMLATTLAAYSPGKRLRFFEILDIDKMTVKPLVQMRSDKNTGTIWYESNDEETFDWVTRYPETFIEAIKLDIMLPGTWDMFTHEDQKKLMDQNIGSLLVKSVFITRSRNNPEYKDFFGILVIEADEKIGWEQKELIEIITASEKISLGILCNDLLQIVSDGELGSVPVSLSQTSLYCVITDREGNIVYAPYSIEDILGYRAYGEMLSRNIARFIYPDDMPRLKNAMEDRNNEGMKIITENIRFVTRTKGVCMCNTRIIPDNSGNVIIKIAKPSWYEIDKVKINENVIYHPKFVEYFTEQIDGIVWMVNDKLEFTYISSYATKLLGWSVDQLIHDPRVSIFDDDTMDMFTDSLIQGAMSYRENPKKIWTDEITGKIKTWDDKLIDVKIGIILNVRGGDYHGFGGVIRAV